MRAAHSAILTALTQTSFLSTFSNTVSSQTIDDGTRDHEVSIPFNLQKSGAHAVLSTFLDTESWNNLLNHGCWCTKLNPANVGGITPNGTILGGCDTIDELDKICKIWIQNRKCCNMEGGPCFNDIQNSAYTVRYDTGLDDAYCLHNSNGCFTDACFTDVYSAFKSVILFVA